MGANWHVFKRCGCHGSIDISVGAIEPIAPTLTTPLRMCDKQDSDVCFVFSISDNAHKGSLYTLFLHSPLSAFCFVTNIVDIPIHMWDKCLAYIDRFLTEASRLLTRSRGVGKFRLKLVVPFL